MGRRTAIGLAGLVAAVLAAACGRGRTEAGGQAPGLLDPGPAGGGGPVEHGAPRWATELPDEAVGIAAHRDGSYVVLRRGASGAPECERWALERRAPGEVPWWTFVLPERGHVAPGGVVAVASSPVGNTFVALDGCGERDGSTLLKVSRSGGLAWSAALDGRARAVAVDLDGSVLVVGEGAAGTMLHKVSWDGQLLWIQLAAPGAASVAVDDERNVYVGGPGLEKRSPAGDVLWALDAPAGGAVTGIAVLPDASAVAAAGAGTGGAFLVVADGGGRRLREVALAAPEDATSVEAGFATDGAVVTAARHTTCGAVTVARHEEDGTPAFAITVGEGDGCDLGAFRALATSPWGDVLVAGALLGAVAEARPLPFGDVPLWNGGGWVGALAE